MKPQLLVGLVLTSHAFAAGEGFVNFIQQTQKDTGVVWSMPVDAKGESASPMTLETGGALFQLWTIEQGTAKNYLLDQKLVGAYLPSASLSVKTLDPYPVVPRTRADQPFTVTYQVSGLLSGVTLPAAATKVLLEQHLANYTPGITAVSSSLATSGKPTSSAYITANGTATLTFAASSLNATDPTRATGEEHFVIDALGDGTTSQTQLASAFVQVWPVASGTIAGVKEGQRIRYNAPALTITLKDLYPRSNTRLQVYPGSPQLGTKGIPVTGSELVLDQDRSDSRVLTVSDYDSTLPKDGIYTIELITETPFGIDRLAYVTVAVDRELEIRAQLNSMAD